MESLWEPFCLLFLLLISSVSIYKHESISVIIMLDTPVCRWYTTLYLCLPRPVLSVILWPVWDSKQRLRVESKVEWEETDQSDSDTSYRSESGFRFWHKLYFCFNNQKTFFFKIIGTSLKTNLTSNIAEMLIYDFITGLSDYYQYSHLNLWDSSSGNSPVGASSDVESLSDRDNDQTGEKETGER